MRTKPLVRGGLLGLVLCLAAGCTVKDDEAKSAAGTTNKQAALALARGLSFDGGEPRTGLMPDTTAPDVTLLDSGGSTATLVVPGDADVKVITPGRT